jgi:hypothetical protein
VQQDVLDPPEDCFRIRLIITLLQTCGHYFSKGSSKRKLDKFLLHFQRYIISKGPLPLDIEFDIQVSSFCIQLADMREYIHKTSVTDRIMKSNRFRSCMMHAVRSVL